MSPTCELLTTLAASLSVALENVRLVEQTRQRAAELAIINDVQQGLASLVEPQAMFDLVGEKLRQIFDAETFYLGILDRPSGLVHYPYMVERGERFPDEPGPPAGFSKRVLETGRLVLLNEGVADGTRGAAGPAWPQARRPSRSSPSRSSSTAPPAASSRCRTWTMSTPSASPTCGSSRRSRAASARRWRTPAWSSRRVTGHRSWRPSTRSARPSRRSWTWTRLVDRLGDQLGRTFDADMVYVAMLDEAEDRIEFPYYSERGERLHIEPMPRGSGLTSRILASGEPLLLNRASDYGDIERVGTPSSSYLGVPILVGDRAIGVISVQSIDEAGRFGDDEKRLLSTLAANVGVAIQNARLYRDSQRRAGGDGGPRRRRLGDLGHARAAAGHRADRRAGPDAPGWRHERGLPGRRGGPDLSRPGRPGLPRRRGHGHSPSSPAWASWATWSVAGRPRRSTTPPTTRGRSSSRAPRRTSTTGSWPRRSWPAAPWPG